MRVQTAFKELVHRLMRLRTTVGGLNVLSLTNEEFGKNFASKESQTIFGACVEPYWPFVWAGGWATATFLVQSESTSTQYQCAPRTPTADIVIDVGCGGGICGLSSLVAPTASSRPPVVVFNDIDDTALQVAGINLEESCRAGCFKWAPDRRLATARRRVMFSNSNLLAMEEPALRRAMQKLSARAAAAEARWEKQLKMKASRTAQSVALHKHADSSPQAASPLAGSGWWSKPKALPSLLVLCGDVTYTADVAKAVMRFAATVLRMAADAPSGTVSDAVSVEMPAMELSHAKGQPSASTPAHVFSSVSVLVSDPGRHAFRQLLGQLASDDAEPLRVVAARSCFDSSSFLELAPVLQAQGLTASVVASYTAPYPTPSAKHRGTAGATPSSITAPAHGQLQPEGRVVTRGRRLRDVSTSLPLQGELEEAAVEGLGGHSRAVSVLQLRLAGSSRPKHIA